MLSNFSIPICFIDYKYFKNKKNKTKQKNSADHLLFKCSFFQNSKCCLETAAFFYGKIYCSAAPRQECETPQGKAQKDI